MKGQVDLAASLFSKAGAPSCYILPFLFFFFL
jgi:hypothetical protein